MSDKLGRISYQNQDKNGHFIYSFLISDYDAAKILEYISLRPHALPGEFKRNRKGQFEPLTVQDLIKVKKRP